MKPSLKGDLATLYNAKATKRRKTRSGVWVEFVYKRDLREYGYGLTYEVRICGVNTNGVPCAADSDNGEQQYFWQCANKQAVDEILANPESAYNWVSVKNGIRRKI